MTFATVRSALGGCRQISSSNASMTLCLAEKQSNSPPALHRLQLTSALAGAFLDAAVDSLRKISGEVASGDIDLKRYDAAVPQADYEVEVYTPPKGSMQLAIINSLTTLNQIKVFSGGNRIINNLLFHVMAIQRNRQSDIYIFRKFSKTKELGRSRKIITLFSDGTFDRISEPVFVFDEYIDAIWIDGKMLIIRKDNFHRIFQFFDDVIRHASATLDEICNAISIDNQVEFVSDCKKNSLILMRLRSISQRKYLPNLTMNKIERKILEHRLPIAISGKGASRKIVYESEHKWKFLHLIDDAFLTSDLTGSKYEATGKRTV